MDIEWSAGGIASANRNGIDLAEAIRVALAPTTVKVDFASSVWLLGGPIVVITDRVHGTRILTIVVVRHASIDEYTYWEGNQP